MLMSESVREAVVFVRYGFHATDLFDGWPNSSRYEVVKSAELYRNCCERALRAAYPDAEVSVQFDIGVTGVLSSALEPQVLLAVAGEGQEVADSPDYAGGGEDANSLGYEVEAVGEEAYVCLLCQRVYEEEVDHWVVKHPGYGLIEVSRYTGLLAPVIWWACERGLLESVEKRDGQWVFYPDSLEEIGNKANLPQCVEVIGVPSSGGSACQCSLADTNVIAIPQVSPGCELLVTAPEVGFGPSMLGAANSLVVARNSESSVLLSFESFCLHHAVGKWAYDVYARELVDRAKRRSWEDSRITEYHHLTGAAAVESVRLRHPHPSTNQTLRALIDESLGRLESIAMDTEVVLSGGPDWKDAYEKDELLFCKEVLQPLLVKTGADRVRYSHGEDEFGRDFLVTVTTPLGPMHHGVQAKTGQISGGANSLIDQIISQIQDAFQMPYKLPGGDDVYITACVIVTSGFYTRNAKEKIAKKIPAVLRGSTYFWDQDDVKALMRRYWLE